MTCPACSSHPLRCNLNAIQKVSFVKSTEATHTHTHTCIKQAPVIIAIMQAPAAGKGVEEEDLVVVVVVNKMDKRDKQGEGGPYTLLVCSNSFQNERK